MTLLHPGYVFGGKTYKTANGLCGAILKDSGCHEMSCVVNNQIKAYASDHKTVVATYSVTPPKFGETQVVTRISEADRLAQMGAPANCLS